ncbi:carboxypeptidase-like regulatory domain-containing protein [Glycomyces sp. L485]|uniref:carboxypeptidase-like regulatory domain-containing protein n=1 Tax=Glycomyces sp. L485 TaxID=2909235 RepID=UPI001F4ADE00|nr:carboxypeptidase-like regulatory domain-containing protein [Glycomyces sp. L485]MCH7229349.1 carboxypeptidase-like regulatory domain-containing protein [Glycomyces sp. L485]
MAQGVGTAWVRLPPGDYRCSVQAGGFAGWWTVTVAEGETVALDSHPDRAWPSADVELPLEPDRFARRIRYWTAVFYGPLAVAIALLIVALPGCLIGALVPGLVDTDRERLIAGGAFGLLVLALWAAMTVHHVGTMRRSKRHRRQQERIAVEPRDTGGPSVYELPMTASKIADATPHGGGVLLDLTWEVVWQRIDRNESIDWYLLEHYGEPEVTGHRPWMPDPTVVIGGSDLHLSWGRWWIPLPQGAHEVELAAPRQGEGERACDDDRFVTWDDTVEVKPGWVTHLRLNGTVIQHYENDIYSLRLTGFESEARAYGIDGNLIGFRKRRLPRRPLDGQTDERFHHSLFHERVRRGELVSPS